MAEELVFCTLGMFIVDEIEYINGKDAETSIIGGAGTYAALGARLAAGARNSRKVGWIVDQGSDFPADFRTIIDRWQTSCLFNVDLARLTTRAWNGYGPNEYRAFKYLTPKLRLEEHSLSDEQVMAGSFHMVCSPLRCITLVEAIQARRTRLKPGRPPPIFVWEPVPGLCTPTELANLQEAVKYVDVVSPNGDELVQFFAETVGQTDRMSTLESILLETGGLQGSVGVVVRDGADGSRLYLQGKSLHFRAYHQDGANVVDPTGGGNTYLGALAIGLTGTVHPAADILEEKLFASTTQKTARLNIYRRFVLAVIHATIAASYAIEQVGTPYLTGDTEDSWNDSVYESRFKEYLQREESHVLTQLNIDIEKLGQTHSVICQRESHHQLA